MKCYGIKNNQTGKWFAPEKSLIFFTTSRAVALAQLEALLVYGGDKFKRDHDVAEFKDEAQS